MAEITAALVKELRERTGAGMMDCKKALTETGGDLNAAIDWLRTKGLSKAAKKSDRVASEGLVGVAVSSDGKTGAAIELNSETDFVARNDTFKAAVADLAELALTEGGDVEALKASKTKDGTVVSDHLTNLIATIGENMTLRRAAVLSVSEGVVASYIHNAAGDNVGRLGVLVALESSGDQDKLAELGRKIAMHVAAASPAPALSVSTEELDPEAIAKEREVFAAQARESGKPENIIEKMVEGRLRKFYEEVVLLKQSFVMNPDLTIEQLLKDSEGDVGGPVKITAFVRLALGEGVEKAPEADFASEVASMAGKK